MYKPKDQKLSHAKARWANGPEGSMESKRAAAVAWMVGNGIKRVDKRASFDDVHHYEEPK